MVTICGTVCWLQVGQCTRGSHTSRKDGPTSLGLVCLSPSLPPSLAPWSSGTCFSTGRNSFNTDILCLDSHCAAFAFTVPVCLPCHFLSSSSVPLQLNLTFPGIYIILPHKTVCYHVSLLFPMQAATTADIQHSHQHHQQTGHQNIFPRSWLQSQTIQDTLLMPGPAHDLLIPPQFFLRRLTIILSQSTAASIYYTYVFFHW